MYCVLLFSSVILIIVYLEIRLLNVYLMSIDCVFFLLGRLIMFVFLKLEIVEIVIFCSIVLFFRFVG